MPLSLYEVLECCTVRLDTSGGGFGTGFFVAPGLILTCAHVVGDAAGEPTSFRTRRKDQTDDAIVSARLPRYFPADGLIYPDLALLTVPTGTAPSVLLVGDVEPGDRMYTFGFSVDYPGGEPALTTCEGMTGAPESLLKIGSGQIVPGMSGGALLNVRTGGVCGIVKRSRDKDSDLGGRAVPTSTILQSFPVLSGLQAAYHAQDLGWQETRSAEQRGQTIAVASRGGSRFERERLHQKMTEQRRRMDAKDEEIEAVNGDLDIVLSSVQRVKLVRQRTLLETERAEIEAVLLHLEQQAEINP